MPIFLQNAEFTFLKTAILPMLLHLAAAIVVISNDVDTEAAAIVIELDRSGSAVLWFDKMQPYQFLSITEIIITMCQT